MLITAISFQNIFVRKKDNFTKKLSTVLYWGFFASLIWLIEKFLFQTFAVSL